MDGTGRAPGYGLQKEGGLNRCFQLTVGWGRCVAANRFRSLSVSEMRPPLSGERNDLMPRAVDSTFLASRWEPLVLPESVLNTISQARVTSTRRLYALKWSVFSAWCTTCGVDTVLCFMLKVYVAAIAASHTPIDGQSVGRNNLEAQSAPPCHRLYPLQRYVQRLAGHRRPYITRPYRPGSFLHNGLTLVIMTNQYGRLPSSCTLLAPNRAPRLYRVFLGHLIKAIEPL